MQLAERDGIACDQCGMQCRQDFIYYSFDFRPVQVEANYKMSLDTILSGHPVFSADICPTCFDKLKTKIINQYSKIMSAQRRTRIETYCELTGQTMVGTYIYYYVVVMKIDVKMTGQPSVCLNCKTTTFDDKKPCQKCQGNRYIRPAAVSAEERHVEFGISEDTYKRFTEAAGRVRQVAGQWSTKS